MKRILHEHFLLKHVSIYCDNITIHQMRALQLVIIYKNDKHFSSNNSNNRVNLLIY